MTNKHVATFGDPTTRTGALYYVADQEGLVQMAVDLELARRHMEGQLTTQVDATLLETDVRRQQTIHNQVVSAAGIPASLRSLIECSKNAEATKLARKLLISEFDLSLLIRNSNRINFAHQSKFREYVPDHLVTAEGDRAKMKRGDVRPFSKKAKPLMLERRHIHVHMFQRESKWHCFHFSCDDIQSNESNHWTGGPHLHYVNHLWPSLSRDQTWSLFDNRATHIAGDLHIRFAPFDYPEGQSAPGGSLSALGSVDFSRELASARGPHPRPTAHIATRGCWIANVPVPHAF